MAVLAVQRQIGRERAATAAAPGSPPEKADMRFMMLMIPKGYADAGADARPDPQKIAAMTAYNRSLAEAGVLLALDGLHPPASGARITFAAGKPMVTDGPFAETKEVIGGDWLIQVGSKDEAIAWAKRCPASDDETIEVRRIFEPADFSPEAQKAAGYSD
jgi:hypothetical protein